jgi:hypothetical protein
VLAVVKNNDYFEDPFLYTRQVHKVQLSIRSSGKGIGQSELELKNRVLILIALRASSMTAEAERVLVRCRIFVWIEYST